jgi:Amt family ammonium transporter
MTFAIITPAPICGSFADRMKFSALLWFIGLWTVSFMRRSLTGCGGWTGFSMATGCSILPAAPYCM